MHTSYLAPRLRWLARTRPDVFAKAARFVSLGEHVQLQLLGHTAAAPRPPPGRDCSTGARASGTRSCCGRPASTNPAVPDPDPQVALPCPGAAARNRWPALAEVPWFPAIGDGLGNNSAPAPGTRT
ncbi:MAG: hypothetical protein R2719_05310 [Micropruina sp.]